MSNKNGYILHKTTDDNYSICRVLNEYKSKDDAMKDLSKLLSNNITEKDLLKKYKNAK